MARDDFIDDTPEGADAGDALGASLIILTTVILIAAVVVIQMGLGKYGIGPFKG